MNMKKYDKLQNKGFNVEQFKDTGLVVQEKLDGSNASFTIMDGQLMAFSRRMELDEHNTLNGFYNWVHDYVNSMQRTMQLENILKDHIIFGEWLVKHKVNYKDEAYQQFYVFDIYEKETETYLQPDVTKAIAFSLGLNHVATFDEYTPIVLSYESTHQKIEDDIRAHIGKSVLSAKPNQGEGIVIKPLINRPAEYPTYKIVTDEFKEFSRRKMNNEKKVIGGVADYAITNARMEKMLFRAIEEGRLTKDDLCLESFSKVIKEVGQDFVDDIMIEEQANIMKIIDKQIKRKMPIVLRDILSQDNLEVVAK